MAAPAEITELVRRFREHHGVYTSGAYNETQLRREFLDPFFEVLGWDIFNKQSFAEAYKDVIHEDALKVGAFTKAPDYCFRVGGTRKFFVEAKKPSVNVKDDLAPAFQVRRYAWSAKLPLSILTDFEEFAVYDCRVKPDKNDKASTARIMYLTYTDFETRWDEIVAIFSKDAVLKGSFDKYAQAVKGKKGTAEVDAAFLHEIEGWREVLARNIALRNSQLSQRELNFAVQQTIDRIIFLRICEDRGMEQEGKLAATTNGTNIYKRLCELFRLADNKYNSGLFHFRKEAERDLPDEMTLGLEIDDKPLKDIIKGLYYPDCPYEFSVISSDILGQVYEQFLGKVIRLTDGHRAVVEDKPEVKKAGGVYYTPTYIVDYIVKNTVGKLLGDQGSGVGVQGVGCGKAERAQQKSPQSKMTPKEASQLRILDPACGSGSFLIGAYQHLLDWHLEWYAANNPQKNATGKNPALYQGNSGDWKLTLAERKRILLDNIYGVDIDPQAVEVTKLSLLLKVLEGESEQSVSGMQKLIHTRVLPDLDRNIKCGNSLIGPDFYAGQQLGFFNDEERLRVNVFDWKAEFSNIMKSGGFDAVIGNPPYVRQESLGDYKDYFQKHYKVYHGIADLYAYFIEQGISLLREGGLFSYIVANKWMRANYGEPLRRWLKQQDIEEIIDFGELPVFKTAATFPCITRVRSTAGNRRDSSLLITQVKTLAFDRLEHYVQENRYTLDQNVLDDGGWTLAGDNAQKLLDKIKACGIPLGEYAKGEIYYGVKTGFNEAFVIDEETKKRLIAEDPKSAELIKPFLAGDDVRAYHINFKKRYLVFTRRGTDIKKYSAIENHLTQFKKKLIPKPKGWKGSTWEGRKPGPYEWYEIQDTVDYYAEFEKPKILYPDISKDRRFTLDTQGFYAGNTCYLLPLEDLYVLGLLNSRLIFFYFKHIAAVLGDADKGGRLRWFRQDVVKIPIRTIDFSDRADKARHDRMVEMVEQMLALNKQLAAANTSHEKTALQRQIDATDHQIDQLVYELYGLDDEEIRIVEGG